jgi:ribonucleoside-diphosphate reductase subunit M1
MATQHPDFSILAARIAISNLHKETTENFAELAQNFVEYLHPKVREESASQGKRFSASVSQISSRVP